MSDHTAGVVVSCSPFGPLDVLSLRAHDRYLGGRFDDALTAARAAIPAAQVIGDQRTLRYLHYTCGLSLLELHRWQEGVSVANALLGLIDDHDHTWRARGLCLLSTAELHGGQVSPAIDALAEACELVQHAPVSYSDLSATMGVANTLSGAYLFDAAADLYRSCLRSSALRSQDPNTAVALVLILQEFASMRLTQGVALELDGDCSRASRCHREAAELALKAMRLTAGWHVEMHARASIIEAVAQQRLGAVALGQVRVQEATERFPQQQELGVVQFGRFAQATALVESGRYEEARVELLAMAQAAAAGYLMVWELAAWAELAELELARCGDHPSAIYARRARQLVARHWWRERQSQFVALRDRMRARALTARSIKLGRDVLRDPLTGLGNRRALDPALVQAAGTCALFIDVDRFKSVNDQFSHAVGDRVLCRVAEVLRGHCRPQDVVIRFGGDEFVVLLPETLLSEAIGVGERVHMAIGSVVWSQIEPGLAVTVSIGVAGAGGAGEDLLVSADTALYSAKRGGRNQVAIS
ncbi:MAG: diguanylate cyclase [Angustibacter sp.]